MKKQAVFLNEFGRQPTSYQLLPLFGVQGGHHLPDAHMTANWTDPKGHVTKLVLLTKSEARLLSKSKRKTSRHTPNRIMAVCPECHKLIPAGRLHQHMPVHYTEETAPIHAAMEQP